MRITLARKNRELVSALNERGYPENVQNWNSFKTTLKKDIEKSSERLLKGVQPPRDKMLILKGGKLS